MAGDAGLKDDVAEGIGGAAGRTDHAGEVPRRAWRGRCGFRTNGPWVGPGEWRGAALPNKDRKAPEPLGVPDLSVLDKWLKRVIGD